MTEDADLPVFLDVQYDPHNEKIPGVLAFLCRFEEDGWPGRVIERELVFQYFEQEKKLFYTVFPTLVQLPLGEANSLEEAIERAKAFLRRWLGKDWQFRHKTAREILRLEEEQETARRSRKGPSHSHGG